MDSGYPMTAGTLKASGNLCTTSLFFNIGDYDGAQGNCANLNNGCNHATYGPAWSIGNNNNCPFDDPAFGSLGPDNAPACGTNERDLEYPAVGWGHILNLNRGRAGSGVNNMQVFVR